MRIKAVTVWQPWASLLVAENEMRKVYETRHWATKYRGYLAIHSAKKYGYDEKSFFYREHYGQCLRAEGFEDPTALPLGKVLGIVRLDGVFSTEVLNPKISEVERSFGNFRPKRFGWRTELVYKLPKPIDAQGAQGLWYWEVPPKVAKILGLK